MSVITKRLLLCLIGILAGATAWPIAEIVLSNQESFNSFFTFSMTQGALFGLILGAFFGISEGLLGKNSRKMVTGVIMGALVGALGGSIGNLIGQKLLFISGEFLFTSYKTRGFYALPISRAIGLGCMGIFVGIAEGFRARSSKKIIVGLLGGLIGGLLGGFIMEYLNILYQGIIVTRLLGFVVLSLLIGLFYGLIEKRLSSGVLQVLNGDLKRRQFLINQKEIEIGSGNNCDITIASYDKVEELHATIKEEMGEVIIETVSSDTKLIVNDVKVDKQVLKYEDVIKLGDIKLFYKHK